LLKHENIDEKKLSRYNENCISEDIFEDQKLLSTVKSTKEISFDLTLISSSTDKRFPGLEEQDDNKSFVIDKNSEYKDLADENKKNNTNKNDTNKNDTNKNNSEKNYPEENDTNKNNNNTRYKTNDENRNYEDDQISV